MKSFFLAVASAVFFATFVFIAYDMGFGHGIDAAREACGNAIIQVGVEGGADLDTIKQMVRGICYQE